MGIIQTQSIKGTIYSYLGVGIGFVITALLFPRILSSEEIGLLKLLVSFSIIFAQFASLGFIQVINRLFPYFRDKDSGHNGLFFLAMIVSLAGFILTIIGFELLKPMLVNNNAEKSGLFVIYINYLIPLILFTSFFNILDTYIRALFDAVIGTFLKEFIQRIFILISIIAYYFDLLDFSWFVFTYVLAISLPTLILIVILINKGEFRLKMPERTLLKKYKKEIFDLCLYGLLIGLSSIAIVQVDSILVNKFLGLSLTGIYATNFFFATIILIPSRPLIKIATTILAEAWKRNDLNEIKVIYQKSSMIQAIIAILIFIGLWVNIENVYYIIPKEYEIGKWVIFYVGLANVVDMFTGINAVIIQTSPSFKINAVITFIFLFLIVGLNILLIPMLGITGAAIASFAAVLVTNSLRYLFLKIKYRLSPFHPGIFIIMGAGVFAYGLAYIIPRFDNLIIDILVRSFVCGTLFLSLIIITRVSEEINSIFNLILSYLRIKK
ncbi:MAG: lipopolysaccharide biosynthesis protein [Bacteroidales bacterium]|nr:lipopolysaccharide biosynthesis protein [Bacteroidales bacterium]MCB8998734.1 lipopolysaccharide biosynthesis protein [Bacteroidales bacterium]